MQFIRRYKLHHLLFWILVYVLWHFFRYQDYPGTGKGRLITFIKVADLAMMVYITNYILIPRLLYRHRYLLFALLFLGIIIPMSLAKLSLIGYILNPAHPGSVFDQFKTRVYDNVLPHIFLVIAGAAAKLIYDYLNAQRRLTDLAREKAEAELNFLKSQINPHFLFNSLNTVYFLIRKDNEEARNALHQFSEMLRYQLYEAKGDRIPIEKEMDYLRDYIRLQQWRKDDKYTVEFNCQPEVRDFSIEPLLLIPLVENAFKHISHHPEGNNRIVVEAACKEVVFMFRVENSKDLHPSTEKSGGIGLPNVKRRLELLYPGRHSLDISEPGHAFIVQLKINLT